MLVENPAKAQEQEDEKRVELVQDQTVPLPADPSVLAKTPSFAAQLRADRFPALSGAGGWGNKRKHVTLPLDAHDEFVEFLLTEQKSKKCKPVPSALLETFVAMGRSKQQVSVATTDSRKRKLEDEEEGESDDKGCRRLKVYEILRPFQKQGFHFAVGRGGRALIGFEMGLGKTCTAIAIAEHYGLATLVLCPSSLRYNWQNELRTHAEIDSLIVKNGKSPLQQTAGAQGDEQQQSQRGETGGSWFPVSIMSYSLFSTANMQERIKRELLSDAVMSGKTVGRRIGLVICDESHFVKNRGSKRTKAVLALSKRVKHVILLSGTPGNQPQDLYTQLKILDFARFRDFYPFMGRWPPNSGSRFFFADRYCDPTKVHLGYGRFEYTFKGSTRPWELNALLSGYMIRRTKAQVLTQLPAKCRQKVVLEPLSLKKQKKFAASIQAMEEKRDKQGLNAANGDIMHLLAETSREKLEPAKAFLSDFLPSLSDEKVLLFAHHREFIDEIATHLAQKLKIKFIQIDGRVKPCDRAQRVSQFSADPEVRVALVGIQAGGTGLNLQAANLVVFLELRWDEKLAKQAEDRVHRMGQKKDVTIKYLVLPGTMDSRMWASISGKTTTAGKIIDNRKIFMNANVLETLGSPTKNNKKKQKNVQCETDEKNKPTPRVRDVVAVTPEPTNAFGR